MPQQCPQIRQNDPPSGRRVWCNIRLVVDSGCLVAMPLVGLHSLIWFVRTPVAPFKLRVQSLYEVFLLL